MTPFELNLIINPEDKSKKPHKVDQDSLIEQKKKHELYLEFYEEDESDLGCRLYDSEFDSMQAYEKN